MAAAGIASSGIVLEVLTKDNYENWSALVKNYLVGQGLWDDNVVGHSTLDQAKNAKALHAIQLSCGSETLTNIRKFETAREAWNHLKASFSKDVKAFLDVEKGLEADVKQLHRDVKRGYWNDAKSRIDKFPGDVFSSSFSTGRTVLHVAVAAGRERIVKELVKMGNERLLKVQDKWGYTALALAAKLTDNIKMAEWMISKGGEELLTMKTKDDDDGKGEIPVLLASAKGHKKMTRYLFSETPWPVLLENKGYYGVMLLTRCIYAEIFDVAATLLQHRLSEELSLTHESECLRPIYALAHMHSAFGSGSQPGWCWPYIYNDLRQQINKDPCNKSIEIVSHVKPNEGPDTNTSTGQFFGQFHRVITSKLLQFLGKICRLISNSMLIKHLGQFFGQFHRVITSKLLKVLGIMEIYERKKNHYLVLVILRCLSKRISRSDESELRKSSAYDAMLQAAKNGITEFVDSMIRANPDLLWAMDKNKRGIFSHAIQNRHEKVFELTHKIKKGQKEIIASCEDVFGNNMLHLAAELGHSSNLGSRSNAALQMQNELQWFNVVERIVPPKCKEAKNADGKKPRELFTKNHEELVKAGEKWAKDTASSFTLVGTLIITIMFPAAFTVPGGNNQETGIPIFLNQFTFTVFIIADALSLFTSSSSVLIFIGILTSRYAEEDFLNRLPWKLLFGLLTVFLAVISMMCAFCAVLAMMLKGYHRLIVVAMLLAIIPILVFIPTLLRLFSEILKATVRFWLTSVTCK